MLGAHFAGGVRKSSSPFDASIACSRNGMSAAAIGTASSRAPFVVSRSYERRTISSRRFRSTSLFFIPNSSPFLRPA